MKRSDTYAAAFVLRGLLAATFGAMSSMALAAASEGAVSNIATEPVAPNLAAPCVAAASSGNGPLTLLVQSPTGSAVRLTYAANDGWSANPATTAAEQVSERIGPVDVSHSTEDPGFAQSPSKPLTVFIDGPTGFTYLWSQERGWKFVGRLTERIQ
ncbi:hypothetical protein [Paraburkholderia diazotrophica]|uniref:Uncharacterized protein n=1 Tax=Paraburkholderia diazotrophica TaxID=667676 RepID=A0A1H7D9E3_9BURK|nr:hypothetical protein [Paraburkholderia diazotrophica]SEJ97944.1 hypothetical protein SAMN05192539_102766 [Paraburkholderia diazotrophica]